MVDNVQAAEDDYGEDETEEIQGAVDGVHSQVLDMSSNVDDYLAEYRYDMVKQEIESLAGLIGSHGTDDLIRLCDIQGPAVETSRSDRTAVTTQVPRLAEADLPPVAGPDEDDVYGDGVIESLRAREGRCASHIRELIDCAGELWAQATAAAEAGDRQEVDEAIRRLGDLSAELESAYSLWELTLVNLYDENPSSLGYTGELLSSTEGWLAQQRRA